MFLLADALGTKAAATCNKLRGVYQNEAFSQESIRFLWFQENNDISFTKSIQASRASLHFLMLSCACPQL
jgi:hypothetical protein